MLKYLFITYIIFNFYYSQSSFNHFINNHQAFLSMPIKHISFDYQNSNIDGISQLGEGSIFIGQDTCKIVLNNYIFLFQNHTIKRYNRNTNQIFIEDNNPEIDSLLFNFFNINNLEKIDLDNNGQVTNLPLNLNVHDLKVYLKFSSDSSSISKLNIQYNQFSFSLLNLNFTNKALDLNNPFSFQFLDAFILDLRD